MSPDEPHVSYPQIARQSVRSQETYHFASPSQSIEVTNPGDRVVEVQVHVRGNPHFKILKKSQKVSLKPGRGVRIPVTFEVPKGAGVPMTLSARPRATLQLWARGEGNDAKLRLIDFVHLEGGGPGLVPLKGLCCFQPDTPVKTPTKGNSPPEITITCYRTGTTTPANTGTVDLTWSVTHAPEVVIESYTTYGAEIIPDFAGAATDAGGEGYELTDSHGAPLTSGAFTDGAGSRSHRIGYYARNADGETSDGEVLYARVGVGYHNAAIPGAASARQGEADDIQSFLDDLDSRLNRNYLANLPDFVDEWNRTCPDPDYRLPEFDDMEYLSGRIGTGCLADDILTAMRNVLIYIKPCTMPRGYRPGTIVAGSGRRALCDSSGSGTVYGISTRNWVSICLETGADALTLLHELFHYASTSHNDNEMRAIAVSCCCFDWIPW